MTEHHWCLGAESPFKVIHAPGCRYAKRPYPFFMGMTEDEVAEVLLRNSSWQWHKGCRLCTPRLEDELSEMRRRALLRKHERGLR